MYTVKKLFRNSSIFDLDNGGLELDDVQGGIFLLPRRQYKTFSDFFTVYTQYVNLWAAWSFSFSRAHLHDRRENIEQKKKYGCAT